MHGFGSFSRRTNRSQLFVDWSRWKKFGRSATLFRLQRVSPQPALAIFPPLTNKISLLQKLHKRKDCHGGWEDNQEIEKYFLVSIYKGKSQPQMAKEITVHEITHFPCFNHPAVGWWVQRVTWSFVNVFYQL